jgi:long-chain acyl-CoA synthetase
MDEGNMTDVTARFGVQRGRYRSIFGAAENWNAPRFPWHDHYPKDVPPGCHIPEIRVEILLEKAAEAFPDRPAIHFYSTTWTYRELLARVRQVAGNFQKLGIKAGDRILFVLPNSPEYVLLWFAAQYCGAEVVPANPLYPPKEVAALLKRTKAKMLIGLDVRLEPCTGAIEEYPVELFVVTSIRPHLPAQLRAIYSLKTWFSGKIKVPASTKLLRMESLYSRKASPLMAPISTDLDQIAVAQPTGGTTGSPKLAMITHRNLMAQVCQNHSMARHEPGTDVVLAVLPFFHVYGSTVLMLSSIGGAATMVLFPRFEVRQLAAAVEKYQPTALPLVPFMFQELNAELLRKPRKFKRLHLVSSGASAIDAETREKFTELTDACICEGYGLSEASPVLTANVPETNRPGTVGMPVCDTEIKIVDAADGTREVPIGEVGELIARGPQIMKGYLDNPEETRQTIRDGWLYTGDLAVMLPDGYFKIVDRKKDMIISGGLNIFPSEVEAKLVTLPNVADAAVVGQRDRRWGERVIAYVVPKPGSKLDPKELKELCRPLMAQYKIPRDFQIVEKLPVSFLGKLRRTELRSALTTAENTSLLEGDQNSA